MCLQVCHTLNREFGAAAIHGDKRQQERDWVLRSFKENQTNVLVATDVAARGLDICDVKLVINFDFPQVLTNCLAPPYLFRDVASAFLAKLSTHWYNVRPSQKKNRFVDNRRHCFDCDGYVMVT